MKTQVQTDDAVVTVQPGKVEFVRLYVYPLWDKEPYANLFPAQAREVARALLAAADELDPPQPLRLLMHHEDAICNYPLCPCDGEKDLG